MNTAAEIDPDFHQSRDAKACDKLLEALRTHHSDCNDPIRHVAPELLRNFVKQKSATRYSRDSGKKVEANKNEPVIEAGGTDIIGDDDKSSLFDEWCRQQLERYGAVGQPTTVLRVQRAVCKHYDVSRHDLLSSRRDAYVVRARHVAVYLAKELTDMSFPAIGRRFGGRDHTSILHAFRKIERLRQSDPELNTEIEVIINQLGVSADAQADSSSLSRNQDRDGAPEAKEPKAHRLAEPIA